MSVLFSEDRQSIAISKKLGGLGEIPEEAEVSRVLAELAARVKAHEYTPLGWQIMPAKFTRPNEPPDVGKYAFMVGVKCSKP